MRSLLKVALLAVMLAAVPFAAQAGTWERIAIGTGSGMVIAGPPGAVVGGVVGGSGRRTLPSPLLDQRQRLSPQRTALVSNAIIEMRG
jgi:hypothetical protein